MHLNSVLISAFSVASVALASPPWSLHRDVVARSTDDSPGGINYTPHWSGAALKQDDRPFNVITGSATAPDVWGPTNSSIYMAVGIGGYSDACGSTMAEVGFLATATPSGTQYQAWYYLPPRDVVDIDIPIFAGNDVKLTLGVLNGDYVYAMIENISTGKSVKQQLQSSDPLCQQSAEWLLGIPSTSASYSAPPTNFSTTTFTGAVAVSFDGQIYTPQQADILDIRLDGQVLTSVSIDGYDSIIIRHT